MTKEPKREYLKPINTVEFVEIVSKLMNITVEQMDIKSRPLVSISGAAVSFAIKGEDSDCVYMVLANDFECRVFTQVKHNFDITYKKPFGQIMSDLIDTKRKFGKTKLTKEQYQQDYNDFHTKKFEEQKAKAEQDHLQQLL